MILPICFLSSNPPLLFLSRSGSALLLLVLMAIGCAIFVILRRKNRQKKLDGDHTGVQWFPLSNNNEARSRGQPISTDEL